MNMKSANRNALALAACALMSWSAGVQAQPDNQPATPGPAAPDAPAAPPPAQPAPTDARDALKKQAGDVDQTTLLKETLTKTERQYSLLKAGRIAANYDLNYSYIGTEAIDIGFNDSGSIDLFKIENTRSHTVTNSVSVDYGLFDNLTVTGTLPFVSKFTQSQDFSGVENGIGDVSFGARFQPFVQTAAGPTFTLTSTVSLPTGRSPFKTIRGSNLSTGAGYGTLTVGINGSQVLDPVALFGSLNFSVATSAHNLHQHNSVDDTTLTDVRPGKSVGFGAGFTYALSYNTSTTVSFQETVTTPSHINYLLADGTPADPRATAMQVAAILNFGLGLRLNPKTTVNLSAGIGLTNDSPDFSLGLNLPLTFSMF
jgi:hypothetical protein